MSKKKGDGRPNVDEAKAVIDEIEDVKTIAELLKEEDRISVIGHALEHVAKMAATRAVAGLVVAEPEELKDIPRPEESAADVAWYEWLAAVHGYKYPEDVNGKNIRGDEVIIVTYDGSKFSAPKHHKPEPVVVTGG